MSFLCKLQVVFFLMCLTTSGALAHPLQLTARELLDNVTRCEGRLVIVDGFVRFDRASRRGFLYSTNTNKKPDNFQNAIFLELGNERYSSMAIEDGSKVVVSGFLSSELHGPLGVYPAHVIVNSVQLADGKIAEGIFKNGGVKALNVLLYDGANKLYAGFSLQRGGVNVCAIERGFARVSERAGGKQFVTPIRVTTRTKQEGNRRSLSYYIIRKRSIKQLAYPRAASW